MPPAIPPKHKKKPGTTDTLIPTSSNITKHEVGQAIVTVDEETMFVEVYITNAAGVEKVGGRITLTMTDNTADSEDTVMRFYHLTNGTLTEV